MSNEIKKKCKYALIGIRKLEVMNPICINTDHIIFQFHDVVLSGLISSTA